MKNKINLKSTRKKILKKVFKKELWINENKYLGKTEQNNKKTQEGILFLMCLLDKFELITKQGIRNL